MPDELSSIDIRILEQVQQDCSLSTNDLADRVGLSQSPCWRRLQRLRDEGYIARQVAILDRSKFGSDQFIFATLKMKTLSEEQRVEFSRKIELLPEITECYSIFGERDILIKVIVSSMEWYQKFIFKMLLRLPGVIDVQSIVALSEMKYTTALPLRKS
ncbi:Lrp/AsnC family transcriptional regulator [Sphingomonas sp. NFX23]|uniref:Lrp/AsnC family transcriptional regulator n=1 Tax=Sphingomonas sp. NFX23 TaxID=2819532 RepID=UPI003CF5D960